MCALRKRNLNRSVFVCILSAGVVVLLAVCSIVYACTVNSVTLYVSDVSSDDAETNSSTSTSIPVGDTAYFYAVCTIDENPDEVGIEWTFDLDGDGTYESTDTEPYDSNGDYLSTTDSHDFNSSGQYTVRVKARLDDGEDTWEGPATCTVDVVEVDKIEYDDPVDGWTEVTETLYVVKGDTVDFRAIRNPSEASWPGGKPVWGGEASGSGDDTVSVTFSSISSSSTETFEVTAECGNEPPVKVEVIVFDWINHTRPQNDFTGGSRTRYGVYEGVFLSCVISPTGLTGVQVGGLRWKKESGVGQVNSVTFNGTAEYIAHTSAGSVKLRTELYSGPSKKSWTSIDSDRIIVEPDGGACIKRSGTNIWHVNNSFSIGVNTDMYLRPTDVSFYRVKFTEGLCNSQTTGWFNTTFTNFWHSAWTSWADVGGGNSTNGCKISLLNGDKAELYDYTPPAYSTGTFLWSIPWSYKADTYTKTFVNMNQEFKVNSSGKAEVQKDSSGWFYNYHSWPSLSY